MPGIFNPPFCARNTPFLCIPEPNIQIENLYQFFSERFYLCANSDFHNSPANEQKMVGKVPGYQQIFQPLFDWVFGNPVIFDYFFDDHPGIF